MYVLPPASSQQGRPSWARQDGGPRSVSLDGRIPRLLPTCAVMGNLIWYLPQFPVGDEHRAQNRKAPRQPCAYTSRLYSRRSAHSLASGGPEPRAISQGSHTEPGPHDFGALYDSVSDFEMTVMTQAAGWPQAPGCCFHGVLLADGEAWLEGGAERAPLSLPG